MDKVYMYCELWLQDIMFSQLIDGSSDKYHQWVTFTIITS